MSARSQRPPVLAVLTSFIPAGIVAPARGGVGASGFSYRLGSGVVVHVARVRYARAAGGRMLEWGEERGGGWG